MLFVFKLNPDLPTCQTKHTCKIILMELLLLLVSVCAVKGSCRSCRVDICSCEANRSAHPMMQQGSRCCPDMWGPGKAASCRRCSAASRVTAAVMKQRQAAGWQVRLGLPACQQILQVCNIVRQQARASISWQQELVLVRLLLRTDGSTTCSISTSLMHGQLTSSASHDCCFGF